MSIGASGNGESSDQKKRVLRNNYFFVKNIFFKYTLNLVYNSNIIILVQNISYYFRNLFFFSANYLSTWAISIVFPSTSLLFFMFVYWLCRRVGYYDVLYTLQGQSINRLYFFFVAYQHIPSPCKAPLEISHMDRKKINKRSVEKPKQKPTPHKQGPGYVMPRVSA